MERAAPTTSVARLCRPRVENVIMEYSPGVAEGRNSSAWQLDNVFMLQARPSRVSGLQGPGYRRPKPPDGLNAAGAVQLGLGKQRSTPTLQRPPAEALALILGPGPWTLRTWALPACMNVA